jgi:hypothetical protein
MQAIGKKFCNYMERIYLQFYKLVQLMIILISQDIVMPNDGNSDWAT